ncbi:MAG TPA: hypothetical protein VN853_07155 [Polyangia bacterium]|nr:hypothetical protein [Polyangia bacterium]
MLATLFHSIALLLALATPASANGNPIVLWLGPFDAGGIDGRALLEAVAVYTRDLNLETRTATGVAPPAAAARAAGRDPAAGAAIRAQGARLGFWCEPAADGQTTSLIIVDGDGRLELRVVEGAGPGPELYRAIALKLRALLAASIGPEAPPAPVEAPSLPPPPLGTPPVPPTPAPPPTAPPNAAATVSATIVAPPPPAADSGRFFAALGYRISAPLGSGSLQQGATGEAGLRLGRAAELALGLAVETHATDTATIGTVSVFDLPIDVAARFVHRGRRVSWGGGGFLAAHLLWATANGFEGSRQTVFDVGSSVGVAALARGALGSGLRAEARLYVELPVPPTYYWIGPKSQILEVGPRVGLGLALVFPSP